MKATDLGREMPECAMPAPPVAEKAPEQKCYPSLYLDAGDQDLSGLPESGTMTVRYKVTSRTVSERNGEKNASLSLDVLEILDAEGEAPKGKTREQELDDLAAGASQDDADE